MSKYWIPDGVHSDINVEHHALNDAGPLTGGGWKLGWHTTESPREWVDEGVRVLDAKNAAPHFIYGWRHGYQFPVVIQCIALNRSARALEHNGGPETNRANVIQVEICEFTHNAPNWEDNWLKGLANLTCWIANRVPIPMNNPRSFVHPDKYSGQGWVNAKGHVGHCHCPGNTHTDPTGMRCSRMLSFARKGPQELKPRG